MCKITTEKQDYNTFDESGILGPHVFHNNLYIAAGFGKQGILRLVSTLDYRHGNTIYQYCNCTNGRTASYDFMEYIEIMEVLFRTSFKTKPINCKVFNIHNLFISNPTRR